MRRWSGSDAERLGRSAFKFDAANLEDVSATAQVRVRVFRLLLTLVYGVVVFAAAVYLLPGKPRAAYGALSLQIPEKTGACWHWT
jgi:hypothetical protein